MRLQKIAAFTLGLMCAFLAQAAENVTKGDAVKGAAIATTVCAACHGMDGNSPIPMYPNLAGQFPEYITKQLTNFKSGERKNPIMAGMVATLSAEDMLNIGAHFATQTPKQDTAKTNGKGSIGEKIYRGGIPGVGVPACASCHGPNGAGIPAQFPRFGGQHADYTLAQLKTFRSGERANDGAKMMRMVAAKLSDQDMAAVADYIQGLR